MNRPSWEDYFLGIAEAVSRRSDCERSRVGAVVVRAKRIVGTGYNGAPAGLPGCASCPRRLSGVAPGSSYAEGAGRCVAVHAEANALLYTDRGDLNGAAMYVTREPCTDCLKLITGAGIQAIYWPVRKLVLNPV